MENQEKKKFNVKTLLAAVCGLAICIAIFALVYSKFGPSSKTTKGGKNITIEVVDNKGKSVSYKLDTDAEFLRGAMDDLVKKTKSESGDKKFTYSGSESQYGIYIETINGVKADYSVDKGFWAIYVNGAMGMNGADSQPVADGDTYKFAYEISEY